MVRGDFTFSSLSFQYLARSSDGVVLESEWAGDQVVLVDFPDLDAAWAWSASPEYQAIAPLRIRNADSVRLLVDGVGKRWDATAGGLIRLRAGTSCEE